MPWRHNDPGESNSDSDSDNRYASQREVDLLNATVFGVRGQGGLLREFEGINKQMDKMQQQIIRGSLFMASSLIALAGVIITIHST